MKITPFNELLKSPHLLASLPIEELENITKNYPWFSLAHSYLAKAYHENNSHKTSGQIALASTLHSNRAWLYGFLKEPILQKEKQTELAPALSTDTISKSPTEVASSAAAPSDTLAQLAASMMDEEIEGREGKRREEEGREVKRGEEEGREENEKQNENDREEGREDKKREEEGREVKRGEEKVREDLDILEKSILATAVSSSIFLEVSETNSSEDIPQDAEQDSAKDVMQDSAKDVMQDSAKDATQGPAEEGENEALFTWLRSVSDSEEDTIEKIREGKKGEEKGGEVKRKEQELRNSIESVQPTLDLIEKFIANEPRITPGKVEQYTGVSFAKDSLEENFDWVTETMAKLYASQGKIDRARKAYKRLIELHPEKKIHFENQLKALNQRK